MTIGWGRGAWGSGPWGTGATAGILLNGLPSTLTLGDPVVQGKATIRPTSIATTVVVGSFYIAPWVVVPPTAPQGGWVQIGATFLYLVDDEGRYLIDDAGSYLVVDNGGTGGWVDAPVGPGGGWVPVTT